MDRCTLRYRKEAALLQLGQNEALNLVLRVEPLSSRLVQPSYAWKLGRSFTPPEHILCWGRIRFQRDPGWYHID